VRVGVLGGTFDPIHIAHLVIAEESRARLNLDEVLFVPAGTPPHKLNKHITAVEHRLAMIQLAIASNPYFVLSRLDIDRPAPSYSVDTIEALRRQLGPQVLIYFIIGMDSLSEMPTWHEPERLVALCEFAVINRPGYQVDLSQLETALPGVVPRVTFVPAPEISVSSSDIQHRVQMGFPIKYQVLPAVEDYIYQHRLYK